MHPSRRRLLEAGAVCAGLWLFRAPAVAQQEGSAAPLAPWLGAERPGELGPTGRRLVARRLAETPGLQGSFAYGFSGRDLRDPIGLVILDGGRAVELERVRSAWYPSHSELSWRGGGLELVERKYLTREDSLVVDFELRAPGPEAQRELLLLLDGAETRRLERLHSRQEVVSLATVVGDASGPRACPELAAGSLEHDGILFTLDEPVAGGPASLLRPAAGGAPLRLPLPGSTLAIRQLHLLLASEGADPPPLRIALDDGSVEPLAWPEEAHSVRREERREWRPVVLPGLEGVAWHLAYDAPPGLFAREIRLEASAGGAPLLVAATLEEPPRTGRLPVLLGALETPREVAHLCLAGDEFAVGHAAHPGDERGARRVLLRHVTLLAGEPLSFRAFLATGSRPLPVLARALDGARDPEGFERHLAESNGWYQEETPRFRCSDPELERAWRERWYGLRRRLFELDRPDFPLPVFHGGVSPTSGPELHRRDLRAVLREARWLGDVRYAQGQVRAFMMRQRESGELPDQLPEPSGWSVEWRLAEALLEVFEVHPSAPFLRESLPLLQAAAEARLAVALQAGDAGRREAVRALAELPALARGRRVLGEEREAAALEALYEATAEPGLVAPPPAERDDFAAVEQSLRARAPRAASNDFLIRRVAGLTPRDDGRLELRPRCTLLEHFAFEGLPYRGRQVDVYWDRPDGRAAQEGLSEGYTVRVDGEVVFHAEELVDVLLE